MPERLDAVKLEGVGGGQRGDAELVGRDVGGAIGSLIFIAIGAAALWHAGEYSMLGAVFPRGIGGLMVALGLLYLVLFALGRTRAVAPLEGSLVRRAGVAGVMLGWAFALVPLGFLGSSALAFVLLLAIANHERWTVRRALLYGASGALLLGGLYVLFKVVLLVPLP
jgi:putative tricarboxylic transport membrane protein